MFKQQPSIVIVTVTTRLQRVLERWGTRGQAKFVLNQATAHESLAADTDESRGQAAVATVANSEADFATYETEEARYNAAVETVRRSLDLGHPLVTVRREHLPNFEFRNACLVIAVGPDGLVANAAKYVGGLPIIGINPDPTRNDGVLLPFAAEDARSIARDTLAGRARTESVTMAEARLRDGQRLLAFNDLFIGRRSHVSARYSLRWRDTSETQSSSGVIVATGTGSTGWLSSVFRMTSGVAEWTGGTAGQPIRLGREERRLAWVVREPFQSRHSAADLVAGTIDAAEGLQIESLMPQDGVIFSDGVEDDTIEFTSGTSVRITVADERANLVV